MQHLSLRAVDCSPTDCRILAARRPRILAPDQRLGQRWPDRHDSIDTSWSGGRAACLAMGICHRGTTPGRGSSRVPTLGTVGPRAMFSQARLLAGNDGSRTHSHQRLMPAWDDGSAAW